MDDYDDYEPGYLSDHSQDYNNQKDSEQDGYDDINYNISIKKKQTNQIHKFSSQEDQSPCQSKSMNLQSHFLNKINLSEIAQEDTNMSHQVLNSIKGSMKKESQVTKNKDKKDRATVEQVLDPRTRVILVKMLNKKMIREINGCVSTGKEANVYHAYTFDNQEYAIKIYKTSILIFKDRERYVTGEFRFRKGHCKSNPRKMIKMWAEKELRNLKRIRQSDINCPEPISVKANVLVMQFIGLDSVVAPRLRDAPGLTQEDYGKIYLQLLKDMRTLYQECKLIHADLSEYNLLYFKDKLYMIDVSQSIEHDHPHALDFLRRDIHNVNNYFKKQNVFVFGLKQIFNFITDINLKKENIQQVIDDMIENIQVDTKEEETHFAGLYLPRTLKEMDLLKAEEDIDKMMNNLQLPYEKVTGLQKNQDSKQNNQDSQQITESEPKQSGYSSSHEENLQHDSNSDSISEDENENNEEDKEMDEQAENEEQEEGEEGEEDKNQEKKKNPNERFEGMTKQERKQIVKLEKREKRKEKLPKHLKKQMIKKSKN